MWKMLAAAVVIVFMLILMQSLHIYAIPKQTDSRLLGSWISDRSRTFENLDAPSPVSNERKDALEKLLGKLKITFTESTATTDLDGYVQTFPYTVLGMDDHSVVFRDDSPPNPDMEPFELSKFTNVHFDGDDAYWIFSELGGFVEYFKRIPETTKN